MLLMGAVISGSSLFGDIHGIVEMSTGFVKTVRGADTFQPVGRFIFAMAERHRRFHCLARPAFPDQPDAGNEEQIEAQKNRMVKGCNDKSDRCLEED